MATCRTIWGFSLSFILMVSWSGSLSEGSLYNASDPIMQLNLTNFNREVLGQNHAIVVEFYNSWCGHCIRYAPEWRAFAKDLQSWFRVVKVAAMDCADDANFNICRDYQIPLYPTVKYFWPQMKPKEVGINMEHNVEVTQLRLNVLNLLQTNLSRAPSTWPRLDSISASSINQIFKSFLPANVKSALLILEMNNSYIGQEVILDVSSLNVSVLRALETNRQLVSELTKNPANHIPHIPALLHIKKSGFVEVLWLASDLQLARVEFRTAIYTFLHIPYKRAIPKLIGHFKGVGDDQEMKAPNKLVYRPELLHMVDLENALRYLLRHEVALKSSLQEEDLRAFKAFLAALTKTFSGSNKIMNFLHRLYDWTTPKLVIRMEDMISFMDELDLEGVRLPELKPWVHCLGSSALYRGYPCGLWSLFHSMTVTAHIKYGLGEMVNPSQVLVAIRDYVLRFFSCSDCAMHFAQMSIVMEKELKHPNDTVLWLWQGHNKVNARLAGDQTEDPQYPKGQFPSSVYCPECYVHTSTDHHWDKHSVLTFLTNFYSIWIVQDTTDPVKVTVADTNSTWKFKYFNRADVSLCLLLYISSAALLLIVYFIVIIRRKRKRISLV